MENGQDISAEIGFQEEIYRRFGESKLKPEQYSALGLAYIGDAVYDLIIRTLVLRRGNYSVKTFHKMTSSIVKAEAQARLVESIEPDLTEEENGSFITDAMPNQEPLPRMRRSLITGLRQGLRR